jgi:hypothetical protein
MCFGSKSSSKTPPPAPPTTFEPRPRTADYSNVDQRKAAVAASTNSDTGQGSKMGAELSGAKS